MNDSESIYGTTLSQESMKVIAESIGVGNLPDEAAKDLAEDVSYRLKEIIQVIIQYFSKYCRCLDSKNELLLPFNFPFRTLRSSCITVSVRR